MDVGFRDRAEQVTALLHDRATRFVLVASPQRDTVVEAVWFAGQLRGQGFEVAATVVNRLLPRFGDGSVDDAATRATAAHERGDEALAAVWSNLAELRTVADAERAQLLPLVERVGNGVTVEVPRLPSDVHDLAALDLLGVHLFHESAAAG